MAGRHTVDPQWQNIYTANENLGFEESQTEKDYATPQKSQTAHSNKIPPPPTPPKNQAAHSNKIPPPSKSRAPQNLWPSRSQSATGARLEQISSSNSSIDFWQPPTEQRATSSSDFWQPVEGQATSSSGFWLFVKQQTKTYSSYTQTEEPVPSSTLEEC